MRLNYGLAWTMCWLKAAFLVTGILVCLPARATDIVVQTAEQSGWFGGASAMAVAADGVTVAIGDRSGKVSFWDLSRRQRLGQLSAVQGKINGVRNLQWVGGRNSVLVTSDQSFAIWSRLRDDPVFQQPRAVRFGEPGLFDLAASGNSVWIAMSAWTEAALLDTSSEGPDRIRPVPHAAGARLALDDEGDVLAAYSYDGLRLYRIPDLEVLWHVPGRPPFEPGQMRFSSDSDWLLVLPDRFSREAAGLYDTLTGERTALPSDVQNWQFLEDGRLLGVDQEGCWYIWSKRSGLSRSPASCRHDGKDTFAVLSNDAVLAARRVFDVHGTAWIGELPVSLRRFELARIDEDKGTVTIAVSPDLTDPDLMAWRDRKPARQYLGPGLYQWDLSTGEQQPLSFETWLAWNAEQWPAWCEPVHDPSVSYRWLSESGELWLGLADRIVRCANGRVQTFAEGLSSPLVWLRVRQIDRHEIVGEYGASGVQEGELGSSQVLLTADVDGALSVYSVQYADSSAQLLQRQVLDTSAGSGSEPRLSRQADRLLDVYFRESGAPWVVMRDGVLDPSGKNVFERWIESHHLDGDDLALGTDQGIAVLDLGSGKVRHWLDTGNVAPVSIRQQLRRVYALMPDGALRIFDRSTGQWIISAYRIGEQGSALITPDGEYAASRAAVSALTRVDDSGLQEFSAFDLQRNRPDRVLARLGYASDAYLGSLKKLHEQRVRRLAAVERINSVLVPKWERTPPLQTNSPEYVLQVQTPAAGFLHVALSGVSVTPKDGFPVDLGVGQVPVRLVPGDNRVTVSFENQMGGRSSVLSAFVHLRKSQPDPVTYLLGVGVSSYAQSQYDLRYAAKDIRDVASYFLATLGSNVRTHLLLNDKATRHEIMQASRFLSQARPVDRVILYFAGHGLLSEKGQFYFAPTDMDFDDPARSGLSFGEIEGLLDSTAARERLIFLDSCHAGQNDDALLGLEPKAQILSNDQDSKAQISSRGLRRVSQIPDDAPSFSRPLLEDVFVDLQIGSGAHVIAASGAAEFALESARWSNGVFTATVLEGLATRAADLDHDRRIDVDELRRFVASRVAQRTQGRQLPTARAVNQALPVVLAEASESDVDQHLPADVFSDHAGNALGYDPGGNFLVMADGWRIVRLDLTTQQRVQVDWELAFVHDIVVSPDARHAVVQVERSSRFASERLLYWVDFEQETVLALTDFGLETMVFRPRLTGAFTADGQWFVIEGDFPRRDLLVIPAANPGQWRRESVRTRGIIDVMAGVVDAQIRLVDEYGEIVEFDAATGQVLDRWVLPVPNPHALEFEPTALTAMGSDGRYFARTYRARSSAAKPVDVLGIWDLSTRRWMFGRELDQYLPVQGEAPASISTPDSYLRPALLALKMARGPRLALLDGASIRAMDLQTEVETGWAYRGSMLSTLPWALAPDGSRIAGIDARGQLVSWGFRSLDSQPVRMDAGSSVAP